MYKRSIVARRACVKARCRYPIRMTILWCTPSGVRASQVLVCRSMLLTSRSIPSNPYCRHHWRHARPTCYLVQDFTIISWISIPGNQGTPCDLALSRRWVRVGTCAPFHKLNHIFRDILFCVGLLHPFTEIISLKHLSSILLMMNILLVIERNIVSLNVCIYEYPCTERSLS